MSVRVFSMVLLSSALIACGGSGSSMVVMDVFLEGDYTISAPSTTPFATDGGECGDAAGTLRLSDGVLSGTVNTNATAFDVTGSVGADGVVTGGGFERDGQIAAEFEGQFEGDAGSGTWQNSIGCAGTWEASLVPV